MYAQIDRNEVRSKVQKRIRARIAGTAQRPRIAVFRSLGHIYVQAIDDVAGNTLAAASTREKPCQADGQGGNIAAAKLVGATIAARLKERGIAEVVFDRGGYRYHGRVKALADAAREGGLQF